MLIEDLHTHTRYSHGKGTIEENVLAAIDRGLKRVGIAEHGPKHLFFPVKWDALLKMRREIDMLQKKYTGKIEIVMGLEANLLGDGLTDVPEDTSIFDYLMLGFHKGAIPESGIGARWFASMLFGGGKKYAKKTAFSYIHAMEKLPKLINITHPGTYIPVDIPLLARAAAAHNITLELNESHESMSLLDIAAARSEGARFYLSSDAHMPKKVGKVEKSIALAQRAGILEYVTNWKE